MTKYTWNLRTSLTVIFTQLLRIERRVSRNIHATFTYWVNRFTWLNLREIHVHLSTWNSRKLNSNTWNVRKSLWVNCTHMRDREIHASSTDGAFPLIVLRGQRMLEKNVFISHRQGRMKERCTSVWHDLLPKKHNTRNNEATMSGLMRWPDEMKQHCLDLFGMTRVELCFFRKNPFPLRSFSFLFDPRGARLQPVLDKILNFFTLRTRLVEKIHCAT